MANEIKYQNEVWGEDTPIAGERLSTNAFYTGQQLGTVLQDATSSDTDQPYHNELNTTHLGTVLQDAVGKNPVKVGTK